MWLHLARAEDPAVLPDPRDVDEDEEPEDRKEWGRLDDPGPRQPKDLRGAVRSCEGDRPAGGWRQLHGVSEQGTTPFGRNLPGSRLRGAL